MPGWLSLTAPDVGAAALAALVAGLAVRPPQRLPEETRPDRAGDERALLARHRTGFALLAGLGVAVLLGGLLGTVAGTATVLVARRVLGRVEAPSVVRRREEVARDLPGAVDLLVAAFAAGAAPGAALQLVAEALGGPVGEELGAVHHRLALGVDPASVWQELGGHGQLAPLGRALGRAQESGSSVTAAGARLAVELRERSRADVEARARSVSTRAAAPLGACFLPAFVLLGIVPLVAGLVSQLGLLR